MVQSLSLQFLSVNLSFPNVIFLFVCGVDELAFTFPVLVSMLLCFSQFRNMKFHFYDCGKCFTSCHILALRAMEFFRRISLEFIFLVISVLFPMKYFQKFSL